jgi:hypothetical protein
MWLLTSDLAGGANWGSAKAIHLGSGCPGGECWGVGQPDKVLVAGPGQPRILISSYFVAPGHSGGPLFNQWWEVVGMLTKLGNPLSEAIPIDSVLSAACDPGCRLGDETLEKPSFLGEATS